MPFIWYSQALNIGKPVNLESIANTNTNDTNSIANIA